MATAFNLTATINLQGPANLGQIVSKIKKEFSAVNPTVKLQIDQKSIKSIQNASAAMKQLENATKSAAASSTILKNNFAGLANTLTSMQNAGLNTAKSMNNLAKANQKVQQNTKQAVGFLQTLERQLFSVNAASKLVAYQLSNIISSGVTSAIRNSTTDFLDFERALNKVAQINPGTNIEAFSKAINAAAGNFGVAQSELAKLSVTLSQAGIRGEDTLNVMNALAKASLAPTFTDMTNATEGVVAAMSQFNIRAADIEKVLGSINAVAGQFAVEANDIVSAIQRAGGVFAQFAPKTQDATQSLNEFAAIFTSVRATTRESAETISAGLRTIFARLQRQGTQDALLKLGINLRNAKGEFIGFYEAFRQLEKGLGQLDPLGAKFAAIVEEIGGIRQIGKLLPAIKEFGSTTEKAFAVAQNGAASLDNAASKAQESLQVQLAKTRAEFQSLVNELLNDRGVKSFVGSVLSLTQSLFRLGKAFAPIAPVFASVFGAKVATGLLGGGAGQLLSGVVGGGSSGTPNQALVQAQTQSVQATQAQTQATSQQTQSAATYTAALNTNTGALTQLTNAINQLSSSGGPPILAGGDAPAFARGGVVPGTGNTDSVKAVLTPGEFVIRKKAVQAIGVDNLHKMNKYAGGGPILDQAVVGASILFPRTTEKTGAITTLEKDNITDEQIISDLPKDRKGAVKAALNKAKRTKYGSIKNSLSPPESDVFIGSIQEGIIDGLNSATSKIGSSLSLNLPQVDEAQKQNFLNSLNYATIGNLFEQVLNAGVAGELGGYPSGPTDPNAPFDFEGNFPKSLIPLFPGLEGINYIDAKASFEAAQKAAIAKKIGNQIYDSEGKGEAGTGGIKSLLQNSIESFKKNDDYTVDEIQSILGTKLKIKASDVVNSNLFKQSARGYYRRLATGGSIEDTVPALLTPGEFVINKKAASRIGSSRLHKLNQADKIQGYNKGGFVGFQDGGSVGGTNLTKVGAGAIALSASLQKYAEQFDQLSDEFVGAQAGLEGFGQGLAASTFALSSIPGVSKKVSDGLGLVIGAATAITKAFTAIELNKIAKEGKRLTSNLKEANRYYELVNQKLAETGNIDTVLLERAETRLRGVLESSADIYARASQELSDIPFTLIGQGLGAVVGSLAGFAAAGPAGIFGGAAALAPLGGILGGIIGDAVNGPILAARAEFTKISNAIVDAVVQRNQIDLRTKTTAQLQEQKDDPFRAYVNELKDIQPGLTDAEAVQQANRQLAIKALVEQGYTETEAIARVNELNGEQLTSLAKAYVDSTIRANAARELERRQVEQSTLVIERANILFRRLGDSLQVFENSINRLVETAVFAADNLTGMAGVGPIRSGSLEVLENPGAFTAEEFRTAVGNAVGVVGGGAQAQQNIGGNAVLFDFFETRLPAILNSIDEEFNATGGDQAAQDRRESQLLRIPALLRQELQNRGVNVEEDSQAGKALARLEELIRANPGMGAVEIQNLIDSDPNLKALRSTGKAALDVAIKALKAQVEASKQLLELEKKRTDLLRQANEYDRKAATISIDGYNKLREIFDQEISLGDYGASQDARQASLLQGLSDKGVFQGFNPEQIADSIIDLGEQNEQLLNARDELMSRPYDGIDLGDQDAVEAENARRSRELLQNTRDIGENSAALNDARQALEELANDTTKADAALKKISERRGRSEAAGGLLRRLATSDPTERAKILQEQQALNASLRGDPRILANPELAGKAFAGFDTIKDLLPKQLQGRMQAQLLGQFAAQQGIGEIAGMPIDQILSDIAGEINPEDKLVQAYYNAVDQQVRAQQQLARLNRVAADKIGIQQINLLAQIRDRLGGAVQDVAAGVQADAADFNNNAPPAPAAPPEEPAPPAGGGGPAPDQDNPEGDVAGLFDDPRVLAAIALAIGSAGYLYGRRRRSQSGDQGDQGPRTAGDEGPRPAGDAGDQGPRPAGDAGDQGPRPVGDAGGEGSRAPSTGGAGGARGGRGGRRGGIGVLLGLLGLAAGGAATASSVYGAVDEGEPGATTTSEPPIQDNRDMVTVLEQIEQNTRCACRTGEGGGGRAGGGTGATAEATTQAADEVAKTLTESIQNEFTGSAQNAIDASASLVTDAIGTSSAIDTVRNGIGGGGNRGLSGANAALSAVGGVVSTGAAIENFQAGDVEGGLQEAAGGVAGFGNAIGGLIDTLGGSAKLATSFGLIGDIFSFARNASRLGSGRSFDQDTVVSDSVSLGADALQIGAQTYGLATAGTAAGTAATATAAGGGGALATGGIAGIAGTVAGKMLALSSAIDIVNQGIQFAIDPAGYDRKKREDTSGLVGTKNAAATGSVDFILKTLLGGLEGLSQPVNKIIEGGYAAGGGISDASNLFEAQARTNREEERSRQINVGTSEEAKFTTVQRTRARDIARLQLEGNRQSDIDQIYQQGRETDTMNNYLPNWLTGSGDLENDTDFQNLVAQYRDQQLAENRTNGNLDVENPQQVSINAQSISINGQNVDLGFDDPFAGATAMARGGIVYAQKGMMVNYQPKGTDTVPAMLTPGEYVVNADSSKKYGGLIEAINNDTLYASNGTMVPRSQANINRYGASDPRNEMYGLRGLDPNSPYYEQALAYWQQIYAFQDKYNQRAAAMNNVVAGSQMQWMQMQQAIMGNYFATRGYSKGGIVYAAGGSKISPKRQKYRDDRSYSTLAGLTGKDRRKAYGEISKAKRAGLSIPRQTGNPIYDQMMKQRAAAYNSTRAAAYKPEYASTLSGIFNGGSVATPQQTQQPQGGNLSQYVDQLSNVQLPNIPDSINVTGTVQVNVTGAAAFTALQGQMQTMINDAIAGLNSQINQQSGGQLGQSAGAADIGNQ